MPRGGSAARSTTVRRDQGLGSGHGQCERWVPHTNRRLTWCLGAEVGPGGRSKYQAAWASLRDGRAGADHPTAGTNIVLIWQGEIGGHLE